MVSSVFFFRLTWVSAVASVGASASQRLPLATRTPLRGNVAGVVPVRCFSFALSPGCVSLKVLSEEISAGFEFFSNHAQSNQPCSHCELGVLGLLWLGACCSQVLCHLAECQAKLNVALELSGVKAILSFSIRSVELEKSEFNGSFVM